MHTLRYGWLTECEFRPITGRKHQLRQHATFCLNKAILGDTKYPNPILNQEVAETNKLKNEKGCGLYLCANGVKFNHPIYDEDNHEYNKNNMKIIDVRIPNPTKFENRLLREKYRYDRLHMKIE